MFAARWAAHLHHHDSWENEDDKNPDLDGDENELYTEDEDEDEDDDDDDDDDAEEHARRKQEDWKHKIAYFKHDVLPKYFPFFFKDPKAAHGEEEKPEGTQQLCITSL